MFEPVLRAAIDTALGVRHVYERDPSTGHWTLVTDPDQVAAIVNQP